MTVCLVFSVYPADHGEHHERGMTMRRSRFERALAVVGAAALLIVGFDAVTYAATGSSLIIGNTNTASTPTVLSNTGAGTALDLRVSNPSTPPLRVNSSAVVPNLHAANSDRLGGAGASSFQRKCQPGSVLARATVVSPSGAGWTVNTGSNYVCSGGQVEVSKLGVGRYEVRFGYSAAQGKSGVTGTPFAQIIPVFCLAQTIVAFQAKDTSVTPHMNYVVVGTRDASGNYADCPFSLALL